mgnify:FL=1
MRDVIVLIASFPLVYGIAAYLDIFETVYNFTQRYEHWQLDEIIIFLRFAAVATVGHVYKQMTYLRREVARKQAAEARAYALARRDSLTGLANRRLCNETLNEHIEAASRQEHGFALMLLDLDRFKPVNDLLGHAAGDILLRHVGERIATLAGSASFVARVGGDEFAILLPAIRDRSDVDAIALKILAGFQQSFELEEKPIRVGASLGIAMRSAAGEDAEGLFRRADMALYQAKNDGRNRFCIYSVELDSGAREREEIEADVRRGLRDGEFIPFFQPLVDLRSGRIVGMEVLARWQHPVRGLLAPSEFIQVAEGMNMIGELTFQVFRKACIASRLFNKELFLAINISQTQLRDQWLPEQIIAVLAETGFPAQRVEVEITEDSLVEDLDMARSILYSLKNQGIRIALDDFGTGYSSLIHLRDLPLDKIKIDRSFVTSRKTDSGSAKIVSAILGLVVSLGLPTVAEGVESDEAARILA